MNSRLMDFARLRLAARNLLRGLWAATALCWIAIPFGAQASPLLSEVYYDAVGTDDGL